MVTSYDEKGKVTFVSGKEIQKNARTLSASTFRATVKGHKSAKRALSVSQDERTVGCRM